MPRRRSKRRRALIEQLMLEARRTGSVSTLHNRAAAESMGIGETDWQCLDVLDWTGPVPAGELARRLGITSGAVTGVLDRLEKAGLVRRVADPDDRRRVIATPCPPDETPAAFMQLAADMDEINDRFDDDQLKAILEWLQASNEAVERSIERFRDRETTATTHDR